MVFVLLVDCFGFKFVLVLKVLENCKWFKFFIWEIGGNFGNRWLEFFLVVCCGEYKNDIDELDGVVFFEFFFCKFLFFLYMFSLYLIFFK